MGRLASGAGIGVRDSKARTEATSASPPPRSFPDYESWRLSG
ncbi:hypothetical protein AB0I58_05535 [Spirillospora sp. NPDC050365]